MLSGCSGGKKGNGPSAHGSLKVSEGKLRDSRDAVVQLKGISTHSIPRCEPLISEDCFKEIAGWGVNVVRLAMYTEAMDSYNRSDYFREKNMALIDKGVEAATAADLYVIIDWHILQDGDPMINMEKAKEFFDTVSKKYSDHNNVFYEICNEPNGDFGWDRIREYAEEVIPVIRNNDDHAVILVGTPSWSSRPDLVSDPVSDDNVMYSFHFYSASHFDEHKNSLRTAVDKGIPVFVTEYGVCADNGSFPRNLASANEWMELLDEYQLSSCLWSFSTAPEAASVFRSSMMKRAGFTDDDLSDTGLWLKAMLKGEKYLGEEQ